MLQSNLINTEWQYGERPVLREVYFMKDIQFNSTWELPEEGDEEIVSHVCTYRVVVINNRMNFHLCKVIVTGLPPAGSIGGYEFEHSVGDTLTVNIAYLRSTYPPKEKPFANNLPNI